MKDQRDRLLESAERGLKKSETAMKMDPNLLGENLVPFTYANYQSGDGES
jgi:hypothetical protein